MMEEREIIIRARALHGKAGEVEIDHDAGTTTVDAGTWVAAWVFVPDTPPASS